MTVLREVERCECILSSSLHGLVLADSLAFARKRLAGLVAMHVRHEWISRGCRSSRAVLAQYTELLDAEFIRRWKGLTGLPAWIPRILRFTKHLGRVPHAYE